MGDFFFWKFMIVKDQWEMVSQNSVSELPAGPPYWSFS